MACTQAEKTVRYVDRPSIWHWETLTCGGCRDLASQLLGAFVQQQAIMQPAGPPGMSPLPAVHQEAFVPPAPKTANGAPQIAQITVQVLRTSSTRLFLSCSLLGVSRLPLAGV